MGVSSGSGRVIAGRYRLLDPLGSGGMGTVWLATDELLRRQVAVKEVYPPTGVTEDERELLRERTMREARTAARLSHPNVVTIYDVAEDDGRPWIVMELLAARTLRELVDEAGPLDPAAAARLGLQVLAALRSAHAIGIMHRDVKPGNVMIDADGRAVLADFGIARAEDSPSITTSGMLVGSPSYIAPERARGERGGPESDLWSLGATLYAAVEGRPAYDRGGTLPTLMAVVSDPPDPPRRAGAMWPVISGLLAADRAERLSAVAAERMLREVAAAGDGAAGDGAGLAAATADTDADLDVAGDADDQAADDVPSTLERAEHSSAFRSPTSPMPEPDAASPPPGPPDPGQMIEPLEPAEEPAELTEPTEPYVPAGMAESVIEPAASTEPAKEAESDEEPAEEPDEPAEKSAEAPGESTVPHGPYGPAPAAVPPRPRRTRVIAAAAALIAVAGTALGLYLADRPSPGHPAAGPSGHAATAPPSSPAASASRTASRTAAASPTPHSSSPATNTAARSGYGDRAAVPPGYRRYDDPTGFSIAMPDDWSVSHQNGYVYLTPPSGGSFLLIDQSDHPLPDPLLNWQQQEANRRSTYPGYHRVRLVAIRYPQAQKAADWEFTYYRAGVLTHVLNRNVLANAQHAYALYWSTPQSDWAAEYRVFTVLARTFQPAA